MCIACEGGTLNQFEPEAKTLGELSYFGFDDSGFSFSHQQMIEGLRSMDGRDSCGLHFSFLEQIETIESGAERYQRNSGTFSVGGGDDQFICYIADGDEWLWLTTSERKGADIFEIAYDSGCNVESGIFPGNFCLSLNEVEQAATYFFLHKAPCPDFLWMPLDFDPWYLD